MTSANCIAGNDIAVVWGELFLKVFDAPHGELSPVIMSVTDLDNGDDLRENQLIRTALDQALLASARGQSCDTVANTIFPRSLWNSASSPDRLYERFMKVFARVRAYPANRKGTYFSRLVDFGSGSEPGSGVNQLRHVLDTWNRGNHRRSALQLAIFDPRLDHTHQRQSGFPCLHQIALSHDPKGRLNVTGFYATQYAYERTYGNLLGLVRLGEFLAHEMGLRLSQVNCVASVEQLGRPSKDDLQALACEISAILENGSRSRTATQAAAGRRAV